MTDTNQTLPSPAGTANSQSDASAIDTLDRLAGLIPGEPRHVMRHNREKIARHTELSDQALFDPRITDITLGERTFAAWYAARLVGIAEVEQDYWQRLQKIENDDGVHARQAAQAVSSASSSQPSSVIMSPRFAQVAEHTLLLSEQPVLARSTHLATLREKGFTTHAIVVLSQLLAYVSYQARVVAMLKAMGGVDNGDVRPVMPPREIIDAQHFTFDTLGWAGWLDIVPLDQASEEQVKVLEESHAKAKTSDYYLLLVHAPEILRQRSLVFNAIMYGAGGISRAERELGATVVSRINGCVYCASVHAQRFGQLAKRIDSIEQVYADPETAGTTAREKAIIQFAIALTRAPAAIDHKAIESLEAVNLTAEEILDLTHSIAIFAWANRLMLTLGEPVFPAA